MQEKEPDIQNPPSEQASSPIPKAWLRFLQLLGAYLVGAWTVLQFLEWIFVRNQISPHWVDFFLWIFVGLLPSFVFYLFNKKRMDQLQFKKVDVLLISGNFLFLFIAMIVGFRSTDLGNTTQEVEYALPDGTLKNTTILKQEFRKKGVLYDFEGLGVDSSDEWLGAGIRTLLAHDILQDKTVDIISRSGQFPLASRIDKALDFFVDGTYTLEDGRYILTPRVYESRNGKLLGQQSFADTDLLQVLDAVNIFIRIQAGIEAPMIENSTDLPLNAYTSFSTQAIQYFCEGSVASLERAVEIDTSFALASLVLAKQLHYDGVSELDMKTYIDLAFRHRSKLPYDLQYAVLSYRHMIYNNWELAEETLKLQLEIDPESDVLNNNMALVYQYSGQFEALLEFTQEWFNRDYYSAAPAYAHALHLNAKTKTLLNQAHAFLQLYPNNDYLLYLIFKAHLINQNWEEALDILKKVKLIKPELAAQFDVIDQGIQYQKGRRDKPGQYEDFKGDFRAFDSERIISCFSHPEKDHLLLFRIPGGIGINFPFSDQALFNVGYDSWAETEIIELVTDSTGLPYGIKVRELSGDNAKERHYFFWKIDALIQNAESALLNQEYEHAEKAYNKAIAANPNHYFLQDALSHIQYAQSKTTAELQDQFKSVEGSFGDRHFRVEGGRLYYKRRSIDQWFFPKMELLPISQDRYCNLTRLNAQSAFDYENGQAVANYTYVYNPDSTSWLKNSLEEDYKQRN